MDYNKLADDLLFGCEENCADCEYAGDIEYECSISQLAAKAITELLTRAEAAEEEAEQMRNDRMKIQYGGEELTVSELCTRLRELVEADREGRCVVLHNGFSETAGSKALKQAMYVCSVTNNEVTRYTADAIAEKLVREERFYEFALEAMEGRGE